MRLFRRRKRKPWGAVHRLSSPHDLWRWQQVVVQSVVCLSAEEYQAEGGRRSGTAHWWLRRGDRFLNCAWPLVPGNEMLDVTTWLLPGLYTLGVGRGTAAIRKRFYVGRGERDRPVFVLIGPRKTGQVAQNRA